MPAARVHAPQPLGNKAEANNDSIASQIYATNCQIVVLTQCAFVRMCRFSVEMTNAAGKGGCRRLWLLGRCDIRFRGGAGCMRRLGGRDKVCTLS